MRAVYMSGEEPRIGDVVDSGADRGHVCGWIAGNRISFLADPPDGWTGDLNVRDMRSPVVHGGGIWRADRCRLVARDPDGTLADVAYAESRMRARAGLP